jgi:diguanylate cyclase (GGDEF)-like protein
MEEYNVIFLDSTNDSKKEIYDFLWDQLGMCSYFAPNMAEAEDILNTLDRRNLFAITNLSFPGEAEYATLDLCLSKNIPTIVHTESFSESLRDEIFSKRIVDYFIKSDNSIEQIVALLKNLQMNRSVAVLIVDDSATFRHKQIIFMQLLQFKVYSAKDGKEALDIILKNPEIRLAVVDLEMPVMNGLELTREIRKIYNKEKFTIMGVSAADDRYTATKFIKYGANDFIGKPFLQEEFNLRVMQNIEININIEKLYITANFDFLTNLHNRRHLFEQIKQTQKKKAGPFGLAIMDIDFFKKINDTYGHDAGDKALQEFAKIMKDVFEDEALLGRIGGEEFCIFYNQIHKSKIIDKLKFFLQTIEDNKVIYHNNEISFTVSCGLSFGQAKPFEEMLIEADQYLYFAKEKGRNRIEFLRS